MLWPEGTRSWARLADAGSSPVASAPLEQALLKWSTQQDADAYQTLDALLEVARCGSKPSTDYAVREAITHLTANEAAFARQDWIGLAATTALDSYQDDWQQCLDGLVALSTLRDQVASLEPELQYFAGLAAMLACMRRGDAPTAAEWLNSCSHWTDFCADPSAEFELAHALLEAEFLEASNGIPKRLDELHSSYTNILEAGHPLLLECQVKRASYSARIQGNYPAADALLDKLRDTLGSAPKPYPWIQWATWSESSLVAYWRNDPELALQLATQATRVAAECFGEGSPEHSESVLRLAQAHVALQQPEAAQAAIAQCSESNASAFHPGHMIVLDLLETKCSAQRMLRQFSLALDTAKEYQSRAVLHHPPGSYASLRSHHLLAMVWVADQDPDQALREMERGIALAQSQEDACKTELSLLHWERYQLLRRMGRFEEALHSLSEACELNQRFGGLDPEANFVVEDQMAQFLAAQGQNEQALVHAKRSLLIAQTAYGPRNVRAITQSQMVGELLRRNGDQAGAERILRQALSDAIDLPLSEQHVHVLVATSLARVLLDSDRAHEALVILERLPRPTQELWRINPNTASNYFLALLRSLARSDRRAEALVLADDVERDAQAIGSALTTEWRSKLESALLEDGIELSKIPDLAPSNSDN